jgi:hypothetical protein
VFNKEDVIKSGITSGDHSPTQIANEFLIFRRMGIPQRTIVNRESIPINGDTPAVRRRRTLLYCTSGLCASSDLTEQALVISIWRSENIDARSSTGHVVKKVDINL